MTSATGLSKILRAVCQLLVIGAAAGYFCGVARSQEVVQMMRGWDVDRVLYKYSTLAACDDHNYTAAATICDSTTTLYSYAVVRTSDGGMSWRIQHLPLPVTPTELVDANFNGLRISKIDQIDSLKAVAVGDSGWIVRTNDGGETWTRVQFPLARKLLDVSFAADGSGILCGGSVVAISSDWGASWRIASFGNSHAMTSCHAYGNGRFRAYADGKGPLYTSMDGGNTADSLLIFPSDSTSLAIPALEYMNGDTLIGFGRNDGTSLLHTNCFVTVSPDGGKTWTTLLNQFFSYLPGAINSISTQVPDLWVGGGFLDRILFSRDHGKTWNSDSVILAPQFGQQFSSLSPVIAVSSTKAIGLANGLGYQGGGGLISFNTAQLNVKRYEYQVYGTHLYPNPASGPVNMVSSYALFARVTLINPLGIGTYEGMMDGSGSLAFDVSHLAAGSYQVMMNYNGIPLHITNLVVLPK